MRVVVKFVIFVIKFICALYLFAAIVFGMGAVYLTAAAIYSHGEVLVIPNIQSNLIGRTGGAVLLWLFTAMCVAMYIGLRHVCRKAIEDVK